MNAIELTLRKDDCGSMNITYPEWLSKEEIEVAILTCNKLINELTAQLIEHQIKEKRVKKILEEEE